MHVYLNISLLLIREHGVSFSGRNANKVICLRYEISLGKCGIKMWRVRKGGYDAGPLHLFDT